MTRPPVRDVGRAAVYAAEIAAFDGTDLEDVREVADVVAAAHEVVDSGWWPGPRVEVRAARRDARSSSARCGIGDVTTIRIAAPQATLATVAHELAHALAGVAHGHDAVFRRAHLDVVAALTDTGPDRRSDLHVRQLADAYRAAALDVAPRGWPAPPATGGPIAL